MIRFDPVMRLRHKLDKLNRIKGLTHAEQGTVCRHTFDFLLLFEGMLYIICRS